MSLSSANLGPVWTEIERTFVAVSLEEIAAPLAIERICGALGNLWGSCTLVAGHHLRGDDDFTRVLVGNAADDTASTLVFPGGVAVEPASLERLRRVFMHLLEIAYPVPRGSKILHQLRNRLAGVQANIEFVEMVLTDPEMPVAPFDERDGIVTALGHAVQSCREMAKTLRDLGTSL